MPHNHAPHCCCYVARNEGNPQPTRCPSCVEHGELARLNMPANAPVNQCPEESPSTGLRCLLEAGHNGAHNTTNTEPWPSECPSCHATGDQPHTDYCRAGLHTTHRWGRVMQGQANFPMVCVNCLVRADRPAAQLACARLDQPAQAQTSQPAATTSQPPTHTRRPLLTGDAVKLCPCQRMTGFVVHHPLCQHHPHNRASTPE